MEDCHRAQVLVILINNIQNYQIFRNKAGSAASLPVYNCTSGGVNPVTWGFFETTGMKITRKFPMENILWYPGGSYKENKMVNSVCEVVQHTLPAHICDFFLWMVGRKQFMVRLVQGGLRNNVCVDDAKK